MSQEKNTQNSSISDVAGLLVTVSFIRDTVAEINTTLKEQNGKLDDLTVKVAVIDEWRRTRGRDDWYERGVVALGILGAAIAGRFKDG
jgi:hypothetical protein